MFKAFVFFVVIGMNNGKPVTMQYDGVLHETFDGCKAAIGKMTATIIKSGLELSEYPVWMCIRPKPRERI